MVKAEDNDLILSSDLDEIPNLESFFKYKNKIVLFEQKVFYYKFNLIQPNYNWIGTRACKKRACIFTVAKKCKGKAYPFWRLDVFFLRKNILTLKL